MLDMSKSSHRKVEQFHVMKREYGALGGYVHIASYRTKAKAEQIAEEVDTKLRGQRQYFYVVWTHDEYLQSQEALETSDKPPRRDPRRRRPPGHAPG